MLNLIIPFKLLSYNQYYRNSRTGKRIKTGAGLAYDEELGELLSGHAKALISFGEDIDLSKNIVKLEIFNFKSRFFTKSGALSKVAGDWDNPIKVLQDKIFKAMEMDDYVIKIGHVEDIPSDEDGVIIKLTLVPLPAVRSFEDFTIGEH